MLIRRSAEASPTDRRRKKQTQAMVKADAPHINRARPIGGHPLLELWFPADPQAVPAARHQALSVCQKAGVSEDDCFTLDLALGEALANAVVHGAPAADSPTHESAAHDVCLCVWRYRDRLIVEVHDRGRGFDPPLPPYKMPAASAQETHGRGLPLMERLTDALMVCRGDAVEGGASIYLVKNVK
jgi:anti-sigma regulatory factor (Ser/Thr protein kinase)